MNLRPWERGWCATQGWIQTHVKVVISQRQIVLFT